MDGRKLLLIVAAAVVLIGGGAVVVANLPRGMRLNNPGNLVKTPPGGKRWVGEIDSPDPRFAAFDTMPHGIRAMAKLLLNYSTKYGLNTVRGIISRYAPSSENNTDSYVATVADRMGLDPDQSFDVQARLGDLVVAMSKQEQGVAAIVAGLSSSDLQAGVADAVA